MDTGIESVLDSPEQGPTHLVPKRQRWIDLGLVSLIVFVPLVFGGVYGLLYPVAGTSHDTNGGFVSGLIEQIGALALLAYVLRRQGRHFKDIGWTFRWTDLPKAAGLYVGAYVAFFVSGSAINAPNVLFTGIHPPYRHPRVLFRGCSLFLILGYSVSAPIFEETL